ncbi:hypothetical protein [Wolbachia endosymbiont (group A) of Rhorus exstirpatorius]
MRIGITKKNQLISSNGSILKIESPEAMTCAKAWTSCSGKV